MLKSRRRRKRLASGDPKQRLEAVIWLGAAFNPSVLELLLPLLEDDDASVRAEVAYVIATRAPTSLLRQQGPEMLLRLIDELGESGGRRSVEGLRALIHLWPEPMPAAIRLAAQMRLDALGWVPKPHVPWTSRSWSDRWEEFDRCVALQLWDDAKALFRAEDPREGGRGRESQWVVHLTYLLAAETDAAVVSTVRATILALGSDVVRPLISASTGSGRLGFSARTRSEHSGIVRDRAHNHIAIDLLRQLLVDRSVVISTQDLRAIATLEDLKLYWDAHRGGPEIDDWDPAAGSAELVGEAAAAQAEWRAGWKQRDLAGERAARHDYQEIRALAAQRLKDRGEERPTQE